MNQTIITQVRAQSVTIPIGAGVGTWLNGQAGAADWVQALLGTDIDYLDLHIYATNYNFLPNAITYADMALAAGKTSRHQRVLGLKGNKSGVHGNYRKQ